MKANEFLQALMDRAGDNPNSLAAKTKVPQPTLFRFLSGTAKEPRTSTLQPLAAHYGVPVEAFLNAAVRKREAARILDGHAAPADRAAPSRVPVTGCAQLGENGWYEEIEAGADGYVETHSSDPDAYALRVRGDSMFPAIRDGWYVVVEPNGAPAAGEYVAIALVDGRKMVKEFLFRSADGLAVQSVNGGARLTLTNDAIQAVHAIGAVLMPSKHREI